MAGAFVSCNGGLASSREDPNFLRQPRAQMISLDFQIIARLQIQPKPLARAKVARQTQRGIRTDRPCPMHDLVDAARCHTEITSEAVLRETERLEKIGRQHLTGMNRTQLSSRHGAPSAGTSVIIDNLDLEGVALPPPEANPPLFIDANTVLTRPIPMQLLEPVAGRHAKIIKSLSSIERHELS
jgi:hypothetical protein